MSVAEGRCPVCGIILLRRRPADYGVCDGKGSHEPVEVKLAPMNPSKKIPLEDLKKIHELPPNLRRVIRKKLRQLPLSKNVKEKYVDGHRIAIVTITDEVLECAERMAQQIRKIARARELEERISGSIQREIVGLLGHLAWAEYAFGNWKEGLQFINVGSGDLMDSTFRGHSIDVKTAGKGFHKHLVIPVAQFEVRKHDFYIGAQLKTPNEVWIHGYAIKEEIEKSQIKDLGEGSAHIIPLKNLHPIDLMLFLKEKGG